MSLAKAKKQWNDNKRHKESNNTRYAHGLAKQPLDVDCKTYLFAGSAVIVFALVVATALGNQIEIAFDQFLGRVSFHIDIRVGGRADTCEHDTPKGTAIRTRRETVRGTRSTGDGGADGDNDGADPANCPRRSWRSGVFRVHRLPDNVGRDESITRRSGACAPNNRGVCACISYRLVVSVDVSFVLSAVRVLSGA